MTISDFKRDRFKSRRNLRSIVVQRQTRSATRLRRRGTFWSLAAAMLLLLIAAAPSLICHSPLAPAILNQFAGEAALDASFKSIRFGWVTPLRVTQLDLSGSVGGSRLRAERIDADVTLLRCLTGLPAVVQTSLSGVILELSVDHGQTSLEADLAALLAEDPTDEDSKSNSASRRDPKVQFDVHNLTVRLRDLPSGELWGLDQARVEGQVAADAWEARFSAVLSAPHAGSGSIDANLRGNREPAGQVQADVNLQGLPLGALTLLRRRFPELASAIPAQVAGDVTGTAQCTRSEDGSYALRLRPLELRNVVLSDPDLGEQPWRNGLAIAEGAASFGAGGWSGQNLQIRTDFAQLTLDGAFARPQSTAAPVGITRWLSAFDGTAQGAIDLVVLSQQLPGALPLRDQTEIVSGKLTGEIVSRAEGETARRVQARLQTEALSARAAGRHIAVEPAALIASLWVDDSGSWRADRCQLTSAFGSASLDGDLAKGRASGDVNLGQLAAMLEPLIDVPELSLGGTATGELHWAAQAGDQWRLRGDAQASDLVIGFPGGLQLHRPTLTAQVDAAGRWDGGHLSELTAAEVSLRSPSLQADASLLAAVAHPTPQTPLPLRIRGQGRLEVLAQFLGPWLPAGLHSLHGGFQGHADTWLSTQGGELTLASVALQEPRGGWQERLFEQKQLAIEFSGRYPWPTGPWLINNLTLSGDALHGAVQGTLGAEQLDCQIAWQGQLGPLQRASQRHAGFSNPVPAAAAGQRGAGLNVHSATFAGPPRLAATAGPGQQADWRLAGNCQGNLRLRRSGIDQPLTIEARGTATELRIARALATTPAANRQGQAAAAAEEVLWHESKLDAGVALTYDPLADHWDIKQLQLSGDSLSTTLAGEVQWNEQLGKARLSGPARIDTEQLATRLSRLAGLPIELTGIHSTPVDITVERRSDGELALHVGGNLGWEAGEVAGIVLGPSSIPLVLSESTLAVQRSTIPVDQGRLHVGGEIHYSPGPLWMQVQPGVVAQNLRLTPELSQRWLRYLAPVLAQATRIDGSFGAELSEATIHFDEPRRSRVRGQLQINQIDFDSGPVTDQLLGSIDQIKLLARGRAALEGGLPAASDPQSRRLATVPTQSVDFEFAGGVVRHQRMFMEIDRAQLVTSGAVDIDGQLDLVTQIPLRDAWLGSDLKGLAGRTVTLPISGTLSRPRLDPAAIRDLVTQVGAQAIQSSAENYLEKQLNRGLEKLLGK